jgi:NAD dependent epimerase/dehydratase family enzyme
MDDLVGAYRFALEESLEGAVNLTSPNPVTNAQFVKALGRTLHRPTVFPLPAVAVRTLFGEMADEALLAAQRVLPARLLDAGFSFGYPELEGALARALTA